MYGASSSDESTTSMHPRMKYRIRDLNEQVMAASDRERALHMVLNGEDDGQSAVVGEGNDANASMSELQKRVDVLQEQMISNAKSFAMDLSTAKLNLMQAQLGGGDSSDDED